MCYQGPGTGGNDPSCQWMLGEFFKEGLVLELGLRTVEQRAPGLEEHCKQKKQKLENMFFSLDNGVQFNRPEHSLQWKRWG